MNEALLLRFHREGFPVPVTRIDAERGVEFANETSARPLGLRLALTHGDEATRIAMERVRAVEDWRNRPDFPLRLGADDGMLRISGGGTHRPAESLPSGRYRLEIGVSDTRLENGGRLLVDIARGERKAVDVHESSPSRRFELIDDPSFDPATWRILSHGQSRIDGLPALRWLRDPSRRVGRKACLLNCLAKLRAAGTGPGSPVEQIVSVEYADIDRVWAEVTPAFVSAIRNGAGGFELDPGSIHEVHTRMRIERLGAAREKRYQAPRNFRQGMGRRSVQVVISEPQAAQEPTFAEIDIDLGNPQADLLGLFIHIGELLDPARTDHPGMYDDLVNHDSLDDFLYYRFLAA